MADPERSSPESRPPEVVYRIYFVIQRDGGEISTMDLYVHPSQEKETVVDDLPDTQIRFYKGDPYAYEFYSFDGDATYKKIARADLADWLMLKQANMRLYTCPKSNPSYEPTGDAITRLAPEWLHDSCIRWGEDAGVIDDDALVELLLRGMGNEGFEFTKIGREADE